MRACVCVCVCMCVCEASNFFFFFLELDSLIFVTLLPSKITIYKEIFMGRDETVIKAPPFFPILSDIILG